MLCLPSPTSSSYLHFTMVAPRAVSSTPANPSLSRAFSTHAISAPEKKETKDGARLAYTGASPAISPLAASTSL